MTTTLRIWFTNFNQQTDETPSTIVFGWGRGWGDYRKDEWPEWSEWGRVIDFNRVPDEILDKEFDAGYGGNESPNLCAWSKSWVLFSDNYDGAESLEWVPRNPIDHEPARPGGG